VLKHQELLKVKRGLRLGVVEGMAGMTMLRLGEQYFPPLALALQASSAQIGLLTSIPNLATAASQLEARQLLGKLGGPKRLFVLAALLQSLSILAIALVAFLPLEGRIWWLIGLVTLFSLFGGLAAPAWGGLMAELIPARLRGRYLGQRNALAGLVAGGAAMGAGALLLVLSERALLGFLIIFAAAFLCRVFSGLIFSKIYEPSAKTIDSALPQAQAATAVDQGNIWRFLIFVFAMNFSISIAGPFFAVYQLRELHFSYLTYSLISTVFVIASLVAMARWGRRADRFGNLKAIWVSALVLPVLPVLWALNPNPFYLGIVQVLSGFAWAGFALCMTNFIFDAAPGATSITWFGRLNATLALAVFAGGITGGLLVEHLPTVLGSRLVCLFLLSGLLRLGAVLMLLPRVHEVRKVSFSPTRVLALEVFGVAALLKNAALAGAGAIAMVWARLREPLEGRHPYPAYVVARARGSPDRLAPVLRARLRRWGQGSRRAHRVEAVLLEHRLHRLRNGTRNHH